MLFKVTVIDEEELDAILYVEANGYQEAADKANAWIKTTWKSQNTIIGIERITVQEVIH